MMDEETCTHIPNCFTRIDEEGPCDGYNQALEEIAVERLKSEREDIIVLPWDPPRSGVADETDVTKPTNAKDVAAALAGRVPLHLFPMSAWIEGNKAFLEGAMKYGAYNYRIGGVQASVYFNAMMRHMVAWFNGEDTDPDSGLGHVSKALACCAVLIDAMAVGCLKDDRPVIGQEPYMLEDGKRFVKHIVEKYPDPVAPFLAVDYPLPDLEDVLAEEEDALTELVAWFNGEDTDPDSDLEDVLEEVGNARIPRIHTWTYQDGFCARITRAHHFYPQISALPNFAIKTAARGWTYVPDEDGHRIFGDPNDVRLSVGERLPDGESIPLPLEE